jgi:hypothetical protein
MRKSRVLLAGVAVAAAAAATSAFTASNTLPATSVVGYGEVAVTGATITNVHYVPNATDSTNIDAVEFTSSTDVTGQTVIMTLKNTVSSTETPTANSPYSCAVKTAYASGSMVLTCDTSAHVLTFADFDLVGLTVTQ